MVLLTAPAAGRPTAMVLIVLEPDHQPEGTPRDDAAHTILAFSLHYILSDFPMYFSFGSPAQQ
jgi:hypothetical protein